MEPNQLPKKHAEAESAPATDAQPKKTIFSKRWLVLGASIFGLLVVALGVYLFFFANQLPRGPKFVVGDHDYAYSCNAFEPQLTASQLGLPADSAKQIINATYAYAPANQQDAEIDLMKLTGNGRLPDTCDMEFGVTVTVSADNKVTYSSRSVNAEIAHYKNGDAANSAFERQYTSAEDSSATDLGSFAEDGFYYVHKGKTGLQHKEADLISAFVLYKNMIISLTTSLAQGSSEKEVVTQIDALLQQVVKRISSGAASRPYNFTSQAQYGGKSFVDSCNGLNYVDISVALGKNVELRPDQVSASHKIVPFLETDEAKEKQARSLESTCTLHFRTASEKAAAKDLKLERTDIDEADVALQSDEPTIRFAEKFPHTFRVTMRTFETTEAAKDYFDIYVKKSKEQQSDPEFLKKQGLSEDAIQVQDAKLADKAIRTSFTLEPTAEQKAEVEKFKAQLEDFENQSAISDMLRVDEKEIIESAKKQLQTMQAQLVTTEGTAYMVLSGQRLYLVTVGYIQTEVPFKTSLGTFTDENMQKILNVLRQSEN